MYLPYWVSATLALFNGASRTADPIGTHHNIFAKNGDQKYYLSVDKVEKGAVPHLVKLKGDKPPDNQGVWLLAWTAIRLPVKKLFVPDTDLCLTATIDDDGELTEEVALRKCDALMPGGGDTWGVGWDDEKPELALYGKPSYRLSYNDDAVGVVEEDTEGWSTKWTAKDAPWKELD